MTLLFLTFLNSLDNDALLLINGFHSSWSDPVMLALTNKWLWIPLSVLLVAVVLRRDGIWKGLLCLAFVGLAIAICDQLCASIIRPAVGRLRPSNLENPISSMVHVVNGYRSGSFGFPSCHGSTTMAIAVFMSLYFKRKALTLFFIGWSVLMCYTRIYLGVHYPGDIIVGMLIGALTALLCYSLYRLLLSRLERPRRHKHLGINAG